MKDINYSDKNSEINTTINTEINTPIKFPPLSSIPPLNITPAAFLAAFHAGPYGLRTFCDQGTGPGKNYWMAGAAPDPAFDALITELHRVNRAEQRGVFFVVNGGGHKDAEITRVTAHFVEADGLSLEQQWENLMAFPLPPSIIVRTRKSLHGYWLMAELAPPNRELSSDLSTNPHLSHFRTIQKQLAAHFSGDPVIANPSRVMRLPGFYHTKAEPVLVRCLLFEPTRRYTQAELAAALGALHPDEPHFADCFGNPVNPAQTAAVAKTVELSHSLADFDLNTMLKRCDFMRYCQEQAATLPEPLWYPMITNLADLPGGTAAIHHLSASHSGYSPAATEAKIAQYRRSGTGPFTCQTLQEWGFACPQLGHCEAHQPRDLGKLPLAPWYTKTKRGLRLIPGVLANALAQHKRVIFSKQCYYQYQNGVYKAVDELHCKRIVRKYLRADHVEMRQINDVIGQWTIEILRSPERLNVPMDAINLKNGLYAPNTQKLHSHDPQILSTIQLAVAYQPQAQAPIFTAFLNDCLDPATQVLVQELFGYLLIPETRAQKAFVLVGEGGAGKSTLLQVMQELLGRDNVSNISWQSLGDTFITAELDGRLANIFADLPSKHIEDSNLFKSITGEDWLTAQRKNKNPFTFKTTARLVFSCNSIPKNLGDRSEAFYRRLIIVPFASPKPLSHRDLHLKDKLRDEAPGILNWALAGLQRLRHNGYRFSESPASLAALASYRVAGSSVLSFVEDCCVVAGQRQVSATVLYRAYQNYAGESGLRSVSHKRFLTELKASFEMVEKIKDSVSRRIVYAGIGLDEADYLD